MKDSRSLWTSALALAAILACPEVRAEMVTNMEVPPQAVTKGPWDDLRLLLSTSYNTDRRSPSDPDRKRDVSMSANPSYRLTPKTTLAALVSGRKDLQGEREFLWDDSYLGATQQIGRSGADTRFSLIGRVYHPTSKASKDYATLRTRLYLAPQVSVGPQTLGGLPLSVLYRPYASMSFHRYEVGLNGKSNSQYALSHRLALEFTLAEKLSLSLDNIYGRSWTYAGNSRDNYSFDQSFSFQATSSLALSLGHNIGGNPLRPNGQEVAVELYDDNTSTFYLGLDYQL